MIYMTKGALRLLDHMKYEKYHGSFNGEGANLSPAIIRL